MSIDIHSQSSDTSFEEPLSHSSRELHVSADDQRRAANATHQNGASQNGAGNNQEEANRVTTYPDLKSLEAAVRTILRAVGEDPDRDGLLETPKRVAKMYAEMFRGLHVDPSTHLEKTFDVECGEIVLIRDIEFTSMCEHHLLPFSGYAHVAYIPKDRVAGLSKFARVVEDVARRPQVQERMTNQIADMVNEKLNTSGVAVVVQAEHSCMAIRGIRKKGSTTVTSALRGQFKTDAASRAEVMSLINNS